MDRQQVQRSTGAQVQASWPFNRYYRFEGSLGLLDTSQDYISQDPITGFLVSNRVSDRFSIAGTHLVGDTTRYQYFGPFQGKRFRVGVQYGAHLSGDIPGDLLQYEVDFRTYKQVTRRSTLARRLGSIYSAGDREAYYGFGGINQLRGYSFRDFYGSRLLWSNLELRFPFIDDLCFPFGPIQGIRGFLFVDAGTAWLANDLFFDPDSSGRRGPCNGTTPTRARVAA